MDTGYIRFNWYNEDKWKEPELEAGRMLRGLIDKRKERLYVCIGTPKVSGDSFGPLVGQLLQDSGLTNVIGTLREPLHAMNIKEYKDVILNKKKCVIAIDACISRRKSEEGWIRLRSGGLLPGSGLDKDLGIEVGNIVIEPMLHNCEVGRESEFLQDYDIVKVHKYSKFVYRAILNMENELREMKNNRKKEEVSFYDLLRRASHSFFTGKI